jgi:hypothetical protein
MIRLPAPVAPAKAGAYPPPEELANALIWALACAGATEVANV